jgi:Ca2+-binding RTX toxin-like protein
VGEATIHNGLTGVQEDYSTPNDKTVTAAKYGVTAATLDEDAYPMLSTVLGTSRNGTHDLIVEEQGSVIDGRLRLYAFDVDTGLYNEFNQVYLGTLGDNIEDKSSITGTLAANRAALYGFGGEDTLIGGAGRDYLFGGKSFYDTINSGAPGWTASLGDYLVGGDGADFFGVGHTNSSGAVEYVSPVNDAVVQADGSIDVSTAFGSTASLVRATSTAQIQDWDAGIDTLQVLENGLAIIDNLKALYDANPSLSLDSGNDLIDLRSYLSIATTDQNASGARGGSYKVWDSEADGIVSQAPALVQGYVIETLQDIFDNQAVRDAVAIANETSGSMTVDPGGWITDYSQAVFNATDVTVRNDGSILVNGGDGNDTIWGSHGVDYLYGAKGNNLIYAGPTASADGVDKIFVDQFFGFQEIRNFVTAEDQVYLNAEVLDVVRSGNGFRDTGYNQGDFFDATSAGFLTPRDISPNLNNVLDAIYIPYRLTYKAILNDPNLAVGSNGAWSNDTHAYADEMASIAMITAGSATVAAGLGLMTNPFTIAIGIPLVAVGTSQIVAGATTDPHRNAQIKTEDRGLINLLDAKVSIATSVSASNSDKKLLDFFYASNPSDGFARALEFEIDNPSSNVLASLMGDALKLQQTDSIVGYYAVHSTTETFIYRVASKDRIVTDNETTLVAEVAGLLNQSNLEAYLGSLDPYNTGLVAPDFSPEATLNVTTSPALSASNRTNDTSIELNVTLDADLENGEQLQLFRGDTLIATLTNANAVGNARTYVFTDNVTVVAGAEDLFEYSSRTVSKDSLVRAGGAKLVIVDRKAPEIQSVSVSGPENISVVVTGDDISASELATVRLMSGGTDVSTSTVNASGGVASFTVPVTGGVGGSVTTYSVEAVDVRGNLVSSSQVIYSLTNSDDGIIADGFVQAARYQIPAGGAITFAHGGDDNILGTADADIVVLGGNGDTKEVALGDGDDTLVVAPSVSSLVANGGGGTDTIDFTNYSSSITVDLATPTSSLPAGSSIIGFENVTGSAFGDNLDGSTAANVINGGAGNDTIDGGSGNDTIYGGAGDDRLTGGSGSDVFVFSSAANNGSDTITDFTSAVDRFDLVALFLTQGATDQIDFVTAADGSEASVVSAAFHAGGANQNALGVILVTDQAAGDWNDVAAIIQAALIIDGTAGNNATVAVIVDNGTDTRLYNYTDVTDGFSASDDLTLLATISGLETSGLITADFIV